MQKPIILIIDDDPVVRQSLEALLAAENYQLVLAIDGSQGLQSAREIPPDVILLDVMMPGMDGFAVCEALRRDPNLAEAPILMITALDDQASRLHGLECGADDFISKPFNRAELRARLRTITRLNRYRSLSIERARFSWMVENAQDGYLLLNEEGKITYANHQARIYLGLAENIFLNFFETAQQQYQPQPAEAWLDWPAIGNTTTTAQTAPLYLVRPETPTAHAFWLQISMIPSENSGDGRRLVQLRNVTEQANTLHDIRKFHSVLEHKFRTPLAHMQISADLLLRRAKKRHLDDFLEMTTHVVEGAARLQAQLDDVFRYIKSPAIAEQGKAFALASLPQLVEILALSFAIPPVALSLPNALQETHLKLTRPAMDMLLWELLENAKKYHPQHTPQVEIQLAQSDAQWVSLIVRDNGIHLSPQQLGWAWQPYIQGEKDFTGEAPGMGLGLPLVRSLIWQVGGQVRLSNRTDAPGVVIEMSLPLA